MRATDFGEDFTWGVASAAWQIEGAWDADGKSPSLWDHADHHRRVKGGPLGEVAIDAYHRYPEDLDLIAGLGFCANRFSLAWTRVLPDGTGRPNPAGIAHYDRVIDACLERGLEPWVTLYHWDMPMALHRQGGWADRRSIEWFAEYSATCAEAFGDRVKHWLVFNEPNMHALQLLGGLFDRLGVHLRRFFTSVHHMNLAIAETGRRLHDALPEGHVIGTTHQTIPFHPFDGGGLLTRRGVAAYEALCNGMFLDPLGGLGYPFEASGLIRRYLEPAIAEGDMDRIAHRFDLLGIQYYQPPSIVPAPIPGLWGVPTARQPKGAPTQRSALGWPVNPAGLGQVLRRYADHPVADRLVITENGAAFDDRLEDGRVHDDLRTWYYRTHLAEVLAAKRDGVPVDGYFCWSYADNIEWALGKGPRFGLIYVDYDDDLRRYPKDSARWFSRLLAGEPDGGS